MLKHPSDMTPAERMDEIASLLATAIIRIRLKKLSKNNDNSLDSSPGTSVYADTERGGKP
jgi:hypothetical protein